MFRRHVKRRQIDLSLNNEDLNSKKARKKQRKRDVNKSKLKNSKKNIDLVEDTGALLHSKENEDDGINKSNNEEENYLEDDAFDEDLVQNDPYLVHLNFELSPSVFSAVSSKPPQLEKINLYWPTLGNLMFIKPLIQEKESSHSTNQDKLLGKTSYAELRLLPETCPEFNWEKLHVKKQILENVVSKSKLIQSSKLKLQEELLLLASNYHDIYFPEENFENIGDIQFVYSVHAINHVLKSRLKIIHHNSKLSKKSVSEEFRDQGLVRPKVLILLPFRETANRIVKLMTYILLGDKDNVMNKKRFVDEYTGGEIIMPEKNPKPPDYQLLFSGNTDDNFKIGLSITKKCLKLYADFYASDIIIASPLGLRMLIGTEGEKNCDYDFLSSIELLIMDQSQVIVMQNWEHVIHIMNNIHLQPKESHGTDLSRVRMWSLNGWSKYYMQSLIFSSHPIPEISALFNSKPCNYGGKISVLNPVKKGSICQVAVQAPQVFHEVTTKSVLAAVDDRFEAFVSDVLPQFKDPSMKHTLIFIPSYFDFVRLRNYFKKNEMKFVQICEYTQEKKITRARSKIFHGKTQFLLYTERFHFYRRIRLRGIRHIIFYQPPTNPTFYSEICNFLHDFKKSRINQEDTTDIELSINVIFTKYDIVQIAAIVGSDRATKMLASEKTVHMFMSD